MLPNPFAVLNDLMAVHENASSFGCGLEPHLLEMMIERHCCFVDPPGRGHSPHTGNISHAVLDDTTQIGRLDHARNPVNARR